MCQLWSNKIEENINVTKHIDIETVKLEEVVEIKHRRPRKYCFWADANHGDEKLK